MKSSRSSMIFLQKEMIRRPTQKESHASKEEHMKTQLWTNKEILRTSLEEISSVDTTS